MAVSTATWPRFDELEILRDEFSESLRAANRRPLTIKSYRLAVDQLREFLRMRGMPVDIRAITREHVEAFLVDLDAKGHRPATRAQRYRSLQQFFKWAVDRDEIERSPMAKMKSPKVEAPLVPVLRDEDIRRLFRACEGRGFVDRRDSAIIRLLLDTGLRRQELVDIRLSDINFKDRLVVVRSGKGDRPGVVRYSEREVLGDTSRALVHFGSSPALKRYMNERATHLWAASPSLWLGRAGPLTADGVAQIVRERGARAGIRNLHPHQLRHHRAHSYLADGMLEGDVMTLMRWSSRAMLNRYGASAATERALQAYDRLGRG